MPSQHLAFSAVLVTIVCHAAALQIGDYSMHSEMIGATNTLRKLAVRKLQEMATKQAQEVATKKIQPTHDTPLNSAADVDREKHGLTYSGSIKDGWEASSKNSGTCEKWCEFHEDSWSEKCDWLNGKCATCTNCSTKMARVCQSWCQTHGEGWPVKCEWESKQCAACHACDMIEGEASTGNERPPSVEVSRSSILKNLTSSGSATDEREASVKLNGTCESWCESHESNWSQKCSWSNGNCATCNNCNVKVGSLCEHWCETHEDGWPVKCKWESKQCIACRSCDNAEEKEASVGNGHQPMMFVSVNEQEVSTGVSVNEQEISTGNERYAKMNLWLPKDFNKFTYSGSAADGREISDGINRTCVDWCENHESSWSEKCSWLSGNCADCANCSEIMAVASRCEDLCETHAEGWSVKCKWESKQCIGCRSCYISDEEESLAGNQHQAMIFVAVHSKRDLVARRSTIRTTITNAGWYKLMFAVCKASEEEAPWLAEEQTMFNDLLFLDCEDGTRNAKMTRKQLEVMKIFKNVYPKRTVLLQVEDDTFIAWHKLRSFLQQQDLDSNTLTHIYMGVPVYGQSVDRDNNSVFFQSEDGYPNSTYPVYMTRAAYAMGSALVKRLLESGVASANLLANREQAAGVWMDMLRRDGVPVKLLNLPGPTDVESIYDYCDKTWNQFPYVLHHGVYGQDLSCLSSVDAKKNPHERMGSCLSQCKLPR